ncbi:restriction endonuclease subunit S [Shewanella sp. SM87]|uniref:restriction endonuclease subunit S n=1 Tax=Shewanella sp. SM87 TaxID=2912808 RepID=UPI0021D7F4A8|nr:restriction endonuclease subunit S [Shewanella sp. SM87]MCU8007322.1 restriction endonuclease subunit S [Shewanella sp. SM87]
MADLSIPNAHDRNIESSPTSENLITTHLDIWTTAIEQKSSAGRGSSNKFSLYGIKKLRELILELAVRGKLVPQDANDEPASVLLERIAAEKAQLVKEGKLKKQKPLLEIGEDEKPFELPESWLWVRLNEIADYNGRPNIDPVKIDNETWLLDLEDIEKDTSKLIYRAKYSERDSKSSKSTFKKGDVLYGKLRPYLNKVIVADDDGICTTEIVAIVPSEAIYAEFLKYLLKSPTFLNYVNSLMYGVKMPRLGTEDALQSVHSLPPLKEQHRIVAKVDELMSLCDALEAQTEASIAAHQTLVETLLNALLLPQTAANTASQSNVSLERPFTNSFVKDWQRVAEHFDTLFTTSASIDTLKQTILQLAVMGKLVKQDPNDEPAAKLLARIAKEKAQLIKEGKIKKQKPLPAITDEEKPFELPQGWEWVRFASMSDEIATGPFGLMIHKRDYIENGVPLINPSHMINSKIKEDLAITVNKDKANELSSYKLFENDIVMARRGEMGRCALVTKREEGWLCGTGSFVLRFNHILSREYILLMFKTNYVFKYLCGESIGTTMTNLNHSILNKMPLLLPSVAEQHRIVAKVDELMALCDQLKVRLADAQITQLHLTDAIVEQAV